MKLIIDVITFIFGVIAIIIMVGVALVVMGLTTILKEYDKYYKKYLR